MKKKKNKYWNRIKQIKKNKLEFQKWKETLRCAICKEDHPACLEFHHLDPSQKDYNISELVGRSMKLIKEEADKCVVLCSNCHRKLHNPR